MNPTSVAEICVAVMALCWGIAGLAFAWRNWKESKSFSNNDDGEDGGGGPDKPATPYDIDPQFDPSDWWKKNDKEKV